MQYQFKLNCLAANMPPKKGRRRRSISSQASGGGPKDDMVSAAMAAMKEQKENQVNMRKNRAYQELRREMEQKRRAKEKVIQLFKSFPFGLPPNILVVLYK